jgi:hypothetical protein
MHATHNARITLLANLLNTMARTCFTVGVAATIAAAFFFNPAGLRLKFVAIGAVIWIIIAAALDLGAQHTLGRLR